MPATTRTITARTTAVTTRLRMRIRDTATTPQAPSTPATATPSTRRTATTRGRTTARPERTTGAGGTAITATGLATTAVITPAGMAPTITIGKAPAGRRQCRRPVFFRRRSCPVAATRAPERGTSQGDGGYLMKVLISGAGIAGLTLA